METIQLRVGGRYTINGKISARYRQVLAVFQGYFEDGIEDCAQVCVFVRGVKVVDLWGSVDSRHDDKLHTRYGPTSLQGVFSSSKAVTSLVLAMLEDRKHVKYDQKVTSVYPEYLLHGKADTTVSQVMRHEAGLQRFDTLLDAQDLTAQRLKEGSLSDIVANQVPSHVPGEQRCYHGITRGFIVGEIARRVDPLNRTVGEFLHDEIAVPLGLEDEICIGLPDKLHERVTPLSGLPTTSYLMQFLSTGNIIPRGCWKIHAVILLVVCFLIDALAFLRNCTTTKPVRMIQVSTPDATAQIKAGLGTVPHFWQAHLQQAPRPIAFWRQAPNFFNMLEVQRAEIPSANGHATARALATLAALVVEGGVLPLSALNTAAARAAAEKASADGSNGSLRLVSAEGIKRAQSDLVQKATFGPVRTSFTNAGWCVFDNSRLGPGREGYVGWLGAGGSVLQWRPDLRIGFGYAASRMEISPRNLRGEVLQAMVAECAAREQYEMSRW
jgi:CubicO group peptidase (beta-lactamase class C family)